MSVSRLSKGDNWISVLQNFGTKVVFFKAYSLLREREREFLLREDTRSKGELGEAQSAQIDVGQLT